MLRELNEIINIIIVSGCPHLKASLSYKKIIIRFREKLSKQNIKNTFRENVLVFEIFLSTVKFFWLHRKYKVLGGKC